MIWTTKEIRLLEDTYPIYGKEAVKYFPGRTKNSIKEKAKVLGIRSKSFCPWSEEEDNILKLNYPSGGTWEVHKLLKHRSRGAIRIRAHELMVKYIRKDKRL